MIGLIVFCFTLGSIRRTTCPSRWIKPRIGGFSFSSVPRPQAPFRRRRRPARPFFLGRQSLLADGALFEFCEVCRRIAAEAGAQDPGVVALFQAGSGFAPFGKIDGREVVGADRGEAGQRGGEDADGAAHDQAWRGDLAAGGASLMVALGAEELLQVVVGRRQPRNLQVVEQAGAVAVGDLEEAIDGVAQGTAGLPTVVPVLEQAGVAGLDVIGRPCSSGSGPRPSGSSAGSQRAGAPQAFGEQGAQLLQLRWWAPPLYGAFDVK